MTNDEALTGTLEILRYTLNISMANICRFLVRIETDLPCSNSSSKDDVLSTYIRPWRRMHLSCINLMINFIVDNTAMENPYKRAITKL